MMKCEIVRCDACGREILPGSPIVRVQQGLCGVYTPGYSGMARAADFHLQCVQVMTVQRPSVPEGMLPSICVDV